MVDTFLIQRCDIVEATPSETIGDFGQTTYTWNKVYTNLKCRYDPRRVRSYENIEEASSVGIDRITFFTEYVNDPIVTNDMAILYDSRVYRIEYVNPMISNTGPHHLEIVSYRATNV